MLLNLALVLVAALVAGLVWFVLLPTVPAAAWSSEDWRRMPWWWRLAGPWLIPGARLFGPLVSWRGRARLRRSIALAALPSKVDYAHIAALRVAGLALASLMMAGLGAVFSYSQTWLALALGLSLPAVAWPDVWLRRRARERSQRIDRDLPFVLDMMTLCVESGLSMHGALQQAVHSGPSGPLRDDLLRTLADMRAGMPRAAALKQFAERSASLSARRWVTVLMQADVLGVSLGSILRSLAAQGRSERFQRAEQLAMEAPVKMLFPLIGCIFPCTFIVLAFPIALELVRFA